MSIILNKPAFEKAKTMILTGKVEKNLENDGQVELSEEKKIEYLKNNNLEEYGLWFLGINTEIPDNQKVKYVYPIGNFDKIQERALVGVQELATKSFDVEVKEAATELLRILYHQREARTE